MQVLGKTCRFLVPALLTPWVILGCGGQASSGTGPAPGRPGGPGAAGTALAAEARSAATGDIPDNQSFLTFRDPSGTYTLVYPEGWAVKAGSGRATFTSNNNVIRLALSAGGQAETASVAAELRRLQAATPSLTFTAPQAVRLPAGPAVKASYATLSRPNAVTGKRVRLLVDRFELARGGRRATIELGSPAGVDNVDAYRKIAQSFRWTR